MPQHPGRRLLAVSPRGLYSGAEVVLERLVGAAIAGGWSVAVATPAGPLSEKSASAGAIHVSIPDLVLPALPRPLAVAAVAGRTVSAAAALRKCIATADVVMVNGLLALPAVQLARPRVPVVWLVHDVVHRADWRLLLRLVGPGLTLAIAPSEAAAAPLRAAAVPVQIIRNGIPPADPRRPRKLPEPPLVIGVCGLLTPLKGQDVALEAVAQLPRQLARLEVLGGSFPKDDLYVRKLRCRASEPDLAGRVDFPGRVDDASQRMASWDIAVLPSVLPEAAPLVVLEAMSVGVPQVISDAGGGKEVIGGAGLLTPAGDAHALAQALTSLATDQGLYERCSSAALQIAGQAYRWDRQRDHLLAALGRLAARRTGPRAVAILVPDFEPLTGGTIRQTGILARAMASRGFEPIVVTRRWQRGWPRREDRGVLRIQRVATLGRNALRDKSSIVTLSARLLRIRASIDVVQVVSYPDYMWAAALAGLLRRTCMTWTGLGDATDVLAARGTRESRVSSWLRRTVYRRCAHVVLTDSMAGELARLGFGDVTVIPVPVELERFRPPTPTQRLEARHRYGVSGDIFTAAYTGHLKPLKGLDALIEAFSVLHRSGTPARLLIAGGGGGGPDDCEATLRMQVRLAGLEDKITFLGVLDDVLPVLHACDAFVLPSLREGMSNSLVEAMACGLPCIAPLSAGGADVLGDAGLVPTDNSPAALAHLMTCLAEDERLRVDLGSRAAARAKQWDPASVSGRYEELYARMAR